MFKQIVLVCGIVLVQCNISTAIECYTCNNTSSLPDCINTVKCPRDYACASEYITLNGTRFYNLGCKDLLKCPLVPTVSHGSSSIIGRSAMTSANCTECCHSNFCNRQICQDPDPMCVDDKSFDCVNVGAITNICNDISHIRPYCRRFCGFCNTEDGGWSHWSTWSPCSVTCGNGTQARTRSCTDPAPANGGSDCKGLKQEQKPCSKDQCPVHGGWSSWSDWGACSHGCDVGLQGRDRTCSNPRPAWNGDYCNGNPHEDMLCFPGPCANGGWSSWGAWGACIGTCGARIKSRNRSCDNPTPSMTGRYCEGNQQQSEPCNVSPCHAVGFSVKEPKPSPTSGQITFKVAVTNAENSFNMATGVFTCKTPGYYYFSTSILKDYAWKGDSYCWIRKNNAQLVVAYSRPPDVGFTMAANSVYVHLVTGDNVTLGHCSQNESMHWYTSFNGFLVTPDAA